MKKKTIILAGIALAAIACFFVVRGLMAPAQVELNEVIIKQSELIQEPGGDKEFARLDGERTKKTMIIETMSQLSFFLLLAFALTSCATLAMLIYKSYQELFFLKLFKGEDERYSDSERRAAMEVLAVIIAAVYFVAGMALHSYLNQGV